MSAMIAQAVDSHLLLPKVHGRLIQNLEAIARTANVPETMVCAPLSKFCSEVEIEYVRGLRKKAVQGIYGLAYVGTKPETPPNVRMMAIAGACLRNFLDAQVLTVQEVVASLKEGVSPDPTVLLIPNFFVGKGSGGSLPDWQISGLLGMLYARQSDGRQTVVYIQGLKGLESEYGSLFRQHIEKNFQILPV